MKQGVPAELKKLPDSDVSALLMPLAPAARAGDGRERQRALPVDQPVALDTSPSSAWFASAGCLGSTRTLYPNDPDRSMVTGPVKR